jgi:hypothetical protein
MEPEFGELMRSIVGLRGWVRPFVSSVYDFYIHFMGYGEEGAVSEESVVKQMLNAMPSIRKCKGKCRQELS